MLLGIANQSYSISTWINPNRIQTSPILHVSSANNGNGSWCLGMLSLSLSGRLTTTSSTGSDAISINGPVSMPDMWTHVTIIYSMDNGLRLYVNTTSMNFTVPFAYSGSDQKAFVLLESSLNATICNCTTGQFLGVLDEFRLYSSELTIPDILSLFNN
ncbi:unnamed protein product [Adineta ricciae]|uniref:LamG domain-containing protein n=2 Tax=Adineta ricciae TaxID=249248 RepID=A0A815S585_ADIRI|nr:unnamed protein product [Adineta ricciae]